MSYSTKCNSLYFTKVVTGIYLVNVFICTFLDHTRTPTVTGITGSFKEVHFLNSYFLVFVLLLSLLLLLLANFSHKRWSVGFYWILSDSKFSQISKTLLGILADLNSAVVWIVLILSPIPICSNPVSKPLEIFLSAPITIGITVIHMFLSFFFFCFFFFRFLARSIYW